MPLPPIHLWLDRATGQALNGPDNPTPRTEPLVLTYGDRRPVSITLVDLSGPEPILEDPAAYALTLAIDRPNPQPGTGWITLEGPNDTAAFPTNATAAEVQTAINNAAILAMPVVVDGYPGRWRITATDTSSTPTLVATLEAATQATVTLTTLVAAQAGLTPAAWLLAVSETPAVVRDPADWTSVSNSPTLGAAYYVHEAGVRLGFTLSPDRAALGGVWTMTVDGYRTPAIRHAATTREIEAALKAARADGYGQQISPTSRVTVARRTDGTFDCLIEGDAATGTAAISVDPSRLTYAPASQTVLPLTGQGLLELFETAEAHTPVTVHITAIAQADDQTGTIARIPATLLRPVVEPTTLTAPDLVVLIDPADGTRYALTIIDNNGSPYAEIETPAPNDVPTTIPILPHSDGGDTYALFADGTNNTVAFTTYGSGSAAALLMTSDTGALYSLRATGTPATLAIDPA